MKVFFLSFRRRKVILFVLVVLVILLLVWLFLRSGDAGAVLNPTKNTAIYQGEESKQNIALECNVVWGTEYIEPMLDVLKEKNIHITFFIGGEWAKSNPDLMNRFAKEGHEIGNHGYSHQHHNNLNLDGNRKEILDTEKVIEAETGIKTTLFAPPYGEFNDTTLQAADSLGYRTIMWSIDTIDWKRDGKEKILQRVMKNPHNGALILMHPTADTVAVLPVIIEKLQGLGYHIGTVSDAIQG